MKQFKRFWFPVLCLILILCGTFLRMRHNDPHRVSAARVASMLDSGDVAALQQGFGSIQFGNSSPASRVNAMASLLMARAAGVTITQAVKDRLIALENATMYQGRAKISGNALSAAISDLMNVRIEQLSNADLAEIGYCTRSLVDLPYDQPQETMARQSLAWTNNGGMSAWNTLAQSIRDESTPTGIAIRNGLPNAIAGEVFQRTSFYDIALADWNSTSGLTPVQAFIIAYSVTTDDLGFYSNANLNGQMQGIQSFMQSKFSGYQGSCAGRKAYGYYGYVFSTHTPLLFNEAIQNALIDRL